MVEKIMKVANDLGYGSVKANVDGENIKFPSVIAAERPQDIQAPMEFDTKQDQDAYMKDFLNNMDVTVSSNAVKTSGRFLVGNAAIDSGLSMRAFDVNDFTGKSETDLAIKYEVSLDNISKINVGKRCRLSNESYPIRKRKIYPKDKKPCPICGNLMDRKATMCKQCSSKQKQTVSNEQIKNIFKVIYEKGFSEASREIGITDNAIKKRLKTMGIPHLIKDFRQ